VVRKKKKLTPEQVDQLTTKECLLEWSSKTLEERTQSVPEKLGLEAGFTISPSTLWHYYHSRKIKYLTTKYSWNLTHNTQHHFHMQKEFVITLVQYMQQGKEIWFMDQTSTQMWHPQ